MFDSFVIEKLMASLQADLQDRHIQRIWAFSRDHFILKISSTQYLSLRFRAESYHISVLDKKPDGETLQNAFVLALKKHLESGKILSIEQIGFDRTVHLVIQGRNNVHETVQFHLYAEMMGRHSNLILCDEQHLVIQALKYSDLPAHPVRMGYPFSPLLSDKKDPFTSREALGEDFMDYKGFHKGLLRLLPEQHRQSSYAQIAQWVLTQSDYCLYLRHNFPADYHIFKNNELSLVETESLYEMLNTFYAQKKHQPQDDSRKGNLSSILYRRAHQLEEKIQKLQQTRSSYETSEQLREAADLIYANLYRLKKGDLVLDTSDFSGERELVIPLDAKRNPSQNAQHYYERYQKMQRGLKHVDEQIDHTLSEKQRIEQLLYDVSQHSDINDLLDIEFEMNRLGLLRRSTRKPVLKSTPREFEMNGSKYYIGRNSDQNEKLAFQTKNRNFVWFHAKNIPGSHVVLHKPLDQATPEDIRFGAQLAAYYSKASLSENTPVDYVQLSHLRKPKGTFPGFVTYVGQKTIYVTPSLNELKQYEKTDRKQ